MSNHRLCVVADIWCGSLTLSCCLLLLFSNQLSWRDPSLGIVRASGPFEDGQMHGEACQWVLQDGHVYFSGTMERGTFKHGRLVPLGGHGEMYVGSFDGLEFDGQRCNQSELFRSARLCSVTAVDVADFPFLLVRQALDATLSEMAPTISVTFENTSVRASACCSCFSPQSRRTLLRLRCSEALSHQGFLTWPSSFPYGQRTRRLSAGCAWSRCRHHQRTGPVRPHQRLQRLQALAAVC
jgi:hypothetical protein